MRSSLVEEGDKIKRRYEERMNEDKSKRRRGGKWLRLEEGKKRSEDKVRLQIRKKIKVRRKTHMKKRTNEANQVRIIKEEKVIRKAEKKKY